MGVCDEVDRYLRLPEIPLQTPSGQDMDALYWWKQHASEYPNLSKLARQLLAAPTFSVSAERMFSTAGKMHDDLKKSTTKYTLEDMLTIAFFFPARDFVHIEI
jgi:hypothetical protein